MNGRTAERPNNRTLLGDVRVAAAFGGPSQLTYITRSGREIGP